MALPLALPEVHMFVADIVAVAADELRWPWTKSWRWLGSGDEIAKHWQRNWRRRQIGDKLATAWQWRRISSGDKLAIAES